MSDKTALILTGPQGSGNHLFAKVLSLHPLVSGWGELNTRYWIGHDEEPYAKFWKDPSKILSHNWENVTYLVTSISCPYFDNGVEAIPDYDSVIDNLTAVGFNIVIAIIGRDTTVLDYQQERVRGRITKDLFLPIVSKLIKFNPTFVSTELLYLYRNNYLFSLMRTFGIPIDYNNIQIDDILKTDPNKKYFAQIPRQQLDNVVANASKPKHLRK